MRVGRGADTAASMAGPDDGEDGQQPYPRWVYTSRQWQFGALGLVVVIFSAAWIILVSDPWERDCEERGGRVVWEVNMAASNAYGECVGAVP